MGALLLLASRSEPASTDSQLYSGCGEARRLRSRIVVVLVVQCIDRYSRTSVCTSYCCWTRLCSARFLLHQRSMPLFDLGIRWAKSSDFGPTSFCSKSDDLGHRILKSEFYAVGCCTIGPHKKTDPFFRSKSKYLKPGIGWHKKHEIDCVSSNPAKGIFRAQKKISRYR